MSNTFKVLRNSAFVLVSAFFFACENPTDIGFPGTDNQKETYFTDTLQLKLETYQMDSVITSSQAAALVGNYTDPVFGKINATAYLQPTLPQETNILTGAVATIPFEIEDNQVYDSLVLRLVNKDNIIFGDSTARMTLNVHRLTQPLPSKNYNFDSEVSYDPTPLASVSITRSSLRTANDSLAVYLRIRLPDTIGEELRQMEGTDTAKDRDAFTKTFRGFVLTASTGANAVNVFNLSPVSPNVATSSLLFYVHKQGDTTALSYQFEFSAARFNQLTSDRAGSSLAELVNKTTSVDISKTNGRTFIQAGTGVATRLRFPGLEKLTNTEIKRAELVFEADTQTFDKKYPKAPFVTYIELQGNQVKRQNNDYAYLNSTMGANSGYLTTYVDSTNRFISDITPYLQEVMRSRRKDDGLAMVSAIPNTTGTVALVFNSGLNRMVLQNFKLNLYYTK